MWLIEYQFRANMFKIILEQAASL